MIIFLLQPCWETKIFKKRLKYKIEIFQHVHTIEIFHHATMIYKSVRKTRPFKKTLELLNRDCSPGQRTEADPRAVLTGNDRPNGGQAVLAMSAVSFLKNIIIN